MPRASSIFLSYNSQDLPVVERLAEVLRKEKLEVWLDERELQPGTPWLATLQQALETSRAVIVTVGPSGLGRWQEPEVEAALIEQVRIGHRVIPVMLPGAPDPNELNIPPFLRRNTWVIFRGGLDDRDAIARLIWGVTDRNPYKYEEDETHSQPSAGKTDPVDGAVSKLIFSLKSDCITYFLGGAASQGGQGLPPRGYEIATELLTELSLLDGGQKSLLLPVDLVGSYYAVKRSDSNLENRIAEMFTRRSTSIPSVHKKLCELLHTLSRRSTRRVRGGARLPQLIVTTNLDVMMERALLGAGMSFTRVVQHGSSPRIDINEYRNVNVLRDGYLIQLTSSSGSPQQVNLHDFDELDAVIATCGARTVQLKSEELRRAEGAPTEGNPLHSLSLQELASPILYKFRGSQDIRDSCVISTDQYFAFARRLFKQNLIPAQISDVIANTHVLFIGFGFMDPDFRLTYHILLRQALEIRNYERYALQVPPELEAEDDSRRLETTLWNDIKEKRMTQTGIITLEERGERFLEKLLRGI